MKLVVGGINGEYLKEIHSSSKGKTDNIKIAVAYASGDPEILTDSFNNGVRVTFWGRYDSTVPISPPILKKFLDNKSSMYECKLVPDILHSKVIWWEDYGAYVGSANLTERAWYNNIEAGIFLTHEEMVENNTLEEIEIFFIELDEYSTPLTDELYREMCELAKKNRPFNAQAQRRDDEFNKNRLLPKRNPLTYIPNMKFKKEKQKNKFIDEWYATLQILRNIANKASSDDFRPSWIESDVPSGVQADQFLHAFYYSQVVQGNTSHHHEFYSNNRKNPEKALMEALEWWKTLEEAPHDEDKIINEWSGYLKTKFDKDNISDVDESEFVGICNKIHALREYAKRVKYSAFGFKPPYPQMKQSERISLLGKHLYKSKNQNGKSIIDVIFHLLYGGLKDRTPDRIWEVAKVDEWRIPHFGISSAGEIVGWAMPDVFPPRNGRTSKALWALGYKVTIHSE